MTFYLPYTKSNTDKTVEKICVTLVFLVNYFHAKVIRLDTIIKNIGDDITDFSFYSSFLHSCHGNVMI